MALSEPRRIRVIGAGPGAPGYLTDAGRLAALDSEVLIGAPRLLALIPEHRSPVAAGPGVEPTLAAIAACRPDQTVAVLVSGDTGLFSLARFVWRRFGRAACEVVPGISALQVAAARVAVEWADACVVDAHGKPPRRSAESLRGQDKIAVFLGSRRAADWLAALGRELGATHTFVACSDLTLSSERVEVVLPQGLHLLATAPRTVLLALRKELCPWP